MKNVYMIIVFVLTFIYVGKAEYGPVSFLVSPASVTVRIGEPIRYNLEIANTKDEPVAGVFVLSADELAGISIEVYDRVRSKEYRFGYSDISKTIFYHPQQLKPGYKQKGEVCVLYDMRRNRFVFDRPGRYDITFRKRWDYNDVYPISIANATVTVLGWDEETDRRSIEASKLWMQRPIAYVYQLRRGELSPDRLEDLWRLTTDYADTVYAKWAAELLEWIETPPKEAENDRRVRKLQTLGVSRGPESFRNLSGFGMMLGAAHAVGRLSQEDIERSIRWAEEYLEFEGDRLSPDNRKYVDDYLNLLRGLRNDGAAATQQ